jgi:hypothetical protein
MGRTNIKEKERENWISHYKLLDGDKIYCRILQFFFPGKMPSLIIDYYNEIYIESHIQFRNNNERIYFIPYLSI